jgi:hypothetical protein
MNWSSSVVAFSSGCARAHSPGVALEASVECFDSSEVFCTFYQGMLSYHGMLCLLSIEVWLSAAEPLSLARTGRSESWPSFIIRPSRSLFMKKEEGGERHTTLVGRVLTVSDELLTGNSSGNLCSIR